MMGEREDWKDSSGYYYPSVLGYPTEADRDFISNARMEAPGQMIYCAFCGAWPEVCYRKGVSSCVIDPSSPKRPYKCPSCYVHFFTLMRLIRHLNKRRHWGAGEEYVQEEAPQLESPP